MGNLTVSAPVDAFMQATTQAGMQAAIGLPISSPTTINVSTVSEFASAWASLANAVIAEGGSVTIQFADGTYNFGAAQYLLNHPFGGRINLVGNTSTPANCVLNFSGPASPYTLGANMQPGWGAFAVTNGNKLGLIDGFTMNGPGMSASNAYGFVCLLAFNGATMTCGPHLVLNNFYSGLAAFFGSSIFADGGLKVTGGGDGNIWAYGHSVISCVGCESSGANRFYSQSGLLADNHSYIFARSSNIHDNGSCAVSLFTGSGASLGGASLTNCPTGIASDGGTGNSFEAPAANTCATPFQANASPTLDPGANTILTTFDGQTFSPNANVQEAIVVNRDYFGRWSQNGGVQHLLSLNASGQPCFGDSSPTTPAANFWTVSNHPIRFGTNGNLALTLGTDQSAMFSGGVTGGVSIIGSGMGGGNALKITSGTSTTFSAICFYDQSSNIEHGAIGWGNQTGGALDSQNYWELSDLSGSSSLNGAKIVQTSSQKGYAWNPRIIIGADLGDLQLIAYDPTTGAPLFTNFGPSGITFNGGTGPHVSNFLVGVDPHTGIQFRSNIWGPSTNSISYFSYGDPLSQNGGHIFSTGGLATSQTIKFVIANDFIQATVPILSPLRIVDETTSFGQVGYDANFCVIYRDNANANTHYCWGGTTSSGGGHRFFTGGSQVSQSLRLQIADDAITAYQLFFPQQAPTSAAPPFTKGAIYFDITLNKLRVGGASDWETISST